MAVWYYVKDIQIFDEDVGEGRAKRKEAKEKDAQKVEYSPVKQNETA